MVECLGVWISFFVMLRPHLPCVIVCEWPFKDNATIERIFQEQSRLQHLYTDLRTILPRGRRQDTFVLYMNEVSKVL